jgi:hypothetical protein
MNPCLGLVARRDTELAGFDVLRALGVRVPKAVGRRILFPGLGAAARALKVHRNHLYLVLAGKRTSHSLMQQYRQYLAGGAR